MIQKKKNLYGTSENIKEEEEASSSSTYKMAKHFQNLGLWRGLGLCAICLFLSFAYTVIFFFSVFVFVFCLHHELINPN